jgi:hypothetical protein
MSRAQMFWLAGVIWTGIGIGTHTPSLTIGGWVLFGIGMLAARRAGKGSDR